MINFIKQVFCKVSCRCLNTFDDLIFIFIVLIYYYGFTVLDLHVSAFYTVILFRIFCSLLTFSKLFWERYGMKYFK